MKVDSGVSAEEFAALKLRYEREEQRLKGEIHHLTDGNAALEDEVASWKEKYISIETDYRKLKLRLT